VVFDATTPADELSARENLSLFSTARRVDPSLSELALDRRQWPRGPRTRSRGSLGGMCRRVLLAEANPGFLGVIGLGVAKLASNAGVARRFLAVILALLLFLPGLFMGCRPPARGTG
jgi:hypothetical protein